MGEEWSHSHPTNLNLDFDAPIPSILDAHIGWGKRHSHPTPKWKASNTRVCQCARAHTHTHKTSSPKMNLESHFLKNYHMHIHGWFDGWLYLAKTINTIEWWYVTSMIWCWSGQTMCPWGLRDDRSWFWRWKTISIHHLWYL